MRKKLFATVVGVLMAVFGLTCCFSQDVEAKEISVRVSPVEYYPELDPGDVYSNTFTYYNEGDSEIDYVVKAVPYQDGADDDGNLSVSYETKNAYTQIADWITFEDGKDRGKLKPNETVEIGFTVKIPMDAPGGGQYAALLVSASAGEANDMKGTVINEHAAVGPIIFAQVNGQTREEGEIKSIDMDGFFFNPPVSVRSVVKNTGNVHAKAKYIIKVYPLFSNESIYNNEESPDRVTVLPESTRYYNLNWGAEKGAPNIGIFRVESEVRMFDKVEKISKIIIICPIWVLILILLFIGSLVFWLVSRSKERKNKKESSKDEQIAEEE